MDLERPELADNLLAAVLRVETCNLPEDLPRRVLHVLKLLSREEDMGLRQTVTNWLWRKVRGVSFGGKIVSDLEDVTMLEDTILEWEQQFLRKGRIDGMRQMLLRVMEERFGPLPPIVYQSLERVRNARKLEQLAGKILKAESLTQVGLGA